MRARVRYRVLAVLVVFLSLVNFAGAVFVWLRLRVPQVTHVTVQEVQPIDPDLLAAITNMPRSVSVLSPAPDHLDAPVFDRVPVPVCLGRYRWVWSVVQDRIFASINGRYLRVGSSSPWGVVVEVWPERIVFEDGNFIENINHTEGGRNDFVSASE